MFCPQNLILLFKWTAYHEWKLTLLCFSSLFQRRNPQFLKRNHQLWREIATSTSPWRLQMLCILICVRWCMNTVLVYLWFIIGCCRQTFLPLNWSYSEWLQHNFTIQKLDLVVIWLTWTSNNYLKRTIFT